MMYVLCFIVVFLNNHMSAMGTAINYGKAITQTHVNNWESAQTSINQLLVDQPTRADLLYDAGVAAYRLQEYPKAQAYFEHVTQSDAPLHLKEQAYFNMGNAYVQQKQLRDAIVAYEQVLDINPDNERAQHNLEIVKQMLQEEEQKQQEEQKQDQQQDKQKQQQQQNNSANNQQNQQKDDAQNKDDQKSQDQTSGSQQNTQDNKQDSNKNDGAENNADQNGEQNKQSNDTGNQKQDGHEQDQQLEQNSQQGTTEQEQRANQHKKSPLPDEDQQKQQSHDMSDEQQNQTDTSEEPQPDIDQASGEQAAHEAKKSKSAKEEQAQDLAEDEKSLDPKEKFIRLVLAQQEDADAQANKRMIKRAIDKNLAGQHGQKRW